MQQPDDNFPDLKWLLIRVVVYTAAPVVLGIAALLFSFFAFAQSGHERWHHYYRHWKQPGTETSCCDARQRTPGGAEIGDCEPTRAELRQGDWWAWERHTGAWLRIPDAKIIRERNPSVEEGHLCWTPDVGIRCFVPPDTGG